MKKNIFVIFQVFLTHTGIAQFEHSLIQAPCPNNNGIVYMNYSNSKLSWVDIKTESGKEFILEGVAAEPYGNISVLNDSLVLLSGKFIYNYKTGTRKQAFAISTFATPSGRKLFQVSLDGIKQIDGFGNPTGNKFTIPITNGTPIHNLTRINENTDFAAITFPGKKYQVVVVYDLKSGKAIGSFDDFKEIHFLDISPDGSQLVIGNDNVVRLYNVSSGKKIGEFEEAPKNNRKHFMQASFKNDGKAVYIASWYKLYTLNTINFEAEANIVVSNNIHITQWNDKYGLTWKEKTVITTDYYWDSYAAFSDNQYIVGIAKHKKEDTYILYYMYLGEGGVGNKNFALQ